MESSHIKRITKTFVSGLGAVIFKDGKMIIFLNSAFDIFGDTGKKYITPIVLPILITSTTYVRCYTRIRALWLRFEEDKKKQSDTSPLQKRKAKLSKMEKMSMFIGITRAVFIALNSYVATNAILDVIHIKNDIIYYIVGGYISISNFITFLAFNVDSMVKNTRKIKNTSLSNCNGKNLFKTGLAGFLGISSFGALSYFLTHSALMVIFGINKLPIQYTYTISALSGLTAIFSTAMSKGVSLHDFISTTENRSIAPNNKKKYYRHITFGTLYTIAMTVGYLLSWAEISKDLLGVTSQTLRQDYLWLILLLIIPAISGGALEFLFIVKPMIDRLREEDDLIASNRQAFFCPAVENDSTEDDTDQAYQRLLGATAIKKYDGAN